MVNSVGIQPFEGIPQCYILAFFSIFAFAHFIKGLFGYGAVPVLVVFGSVVFPPHHTIVLAAITNLFSHSFYLPDAYRKGDRELALHMLIYLIPTVTIGVWLFSSLASDDLAFLTGVLMLLVVALEISGFISWTALRVRTHARIIGPIVAGLSGIMNGVIGAGAVVFLSVYLRVMCEAKERFRATVLLVTGGMILWRSVVLLIFGLVDGKLVFEAAVLTPIAIIAGYAGSRVMMSVGTKSFFGLYQILLASGAGVLIWRTWP